MRKKSLVEQAKNIKTRRFTNKNITNEDVQLALEWVNGNVTLGQIRSVKKISSTTVTYPYLLYCLRRHILNSKIKTK